MKAHRSYTATIRRTVSSTALAIGLGVVPAPALAQTTIPVSYTHLTLPTNREV